MNLMPESVLTVFNLNDSQISNLYVIKLRAVIAASNVSKKHETSKHRAQISLPAFINNDIIIYNLICVSFFFFRFFPVRTNQA